MKLTESMLRSIIREELSTMLELDEVLSAKERKEQEKRERAAELRKHRPKSGTGTSQRDRFDSDKPDAPTRPFNPAYYRGGQ